MRMRIPSSAMLAAALVLPGACQAQAPQSEAASSTQAAAPADTEAYTGPVVYRAEIVATYPHDSAAFTQGLLWHDGRLFESTGREGQSVVREVDLATGDVLKESAIPSDQFGEGLAWWDGELVSLTWRNGAIHRWDGNTLANLGTRQDYPLVGWGLTSSEEGLIHSDGSQTLRVLDPETYDVRRSIEVSMNGRPLRKLNELELIDGLVYANIWETPYIVAIDPANGEVKRLVDLTDLVGNVPIAERDAVLNGIAWDAENRRLFVTGKLWPSLFEIRLVETEGRVN